MAQNVAEILRTLRQRAGLSRDDLAREAGFSRKTSLQYYEIASRWHGRKFPIEFVAKITPALVGRGSPPIDAAEIMALAESGAGAVIPSIRVSVVPVYRWGCMTIDRLDNNRPEAIAALEIAGLSTANHAAAILPDAHAAQIAPAGAHVVFDVADRELRDGAVFLVVLPGVGPQVRRYRANPPRFESLAFPPADAHYHTTRLDIVGRLRAVVNLYS